MAIIYTYPVKTTPNANDLILISDSQDSNKTKQVKISTLPGGSGSGVSSVTSANNAITVADATTTPVLTSIAYSGGTNIGHVPTGSGNSATVYLDGTGNWSTPSGSGGTPGVPVNSLQFNNAGAFGGSELLTYANRILEVGAVGASGGNHLKVYGGGSDDAKLTLYCSAGTHGVTIEGPQHNQGTNYTLKLPKTITTQTVYSSGGRILESDANGALQWIITPTSGGSPGGLTTQYQYNNSGAFAGTNLLRFDADAIHVGIAGGTPEKGKMILYSDGTSTGAPTIELKNSANAHGVTIKGSVDAGGSADYDFILPIANGASGQYLKLDSNLALEYTCLLYTSDAADE